MRKLFILISLLATMLIASPVPVATAAQISKQQAANIAQSQFKGRVIAVDESTQNGTAVYRVKVLDQSGGMHTVVVDRQSGNVISAH